LVTTFGMTAKTAITGAEVAVVVVDRVAPGVDRCRAGAGDVLPFGIGEQTVEVIMTGFFVQPPDIGDGVIKTVQPTVRNDAPWEPVERSGGGYCNASEM
jgi:hypothetical protein